MWAQKTIEQICGRKNPLRVFRIIFLGQKATKKLMGYVSAQMPSSLPLSWIVFLCVPEWSSFQDHMQKNFQAGQKNLIIT